MRQRIITYLELFTGDALARFFGWMLVVASTLGLMSSIMTSRALSGMFGLSLGMGAWLLLRTVNLFDYSDSTRQLMSESRASRSKHAHQLHRQPITFGKRTESNLHTALLVLGGTCLALVPTWYLETALTTVQATTLINLLALCLAMVYALSRQKTWLLYLALFTGYFVLVYSESAVFALSSLLVLTSFAAYLAWMARDRVLLVGSQVASVVSLLAWTNQYSTGGLFAPLDPLANWPTERLLLMVGVAMQLLIYAGPYALKRREVGEMATAKMVLIIAAIAFVLNMTWLTEYAQGMQWLMSLSVLACISASMAYLAWTQHGRYSYAKYFLSIGLGALLYTIYVWVSPTVMSLSWLVLSIIVSGVGFVLASYSARMAGLGLLAVTVTHYLVVLLGHDTGYVGPFWLHDRVWVGALIGTYLMVLAFWYREGKFRGNEARLRLVIMQSLLTSGALVLLGAASVELQGAAQSLAWIVVSLVLVYLGTRLHNQLSAALGLGLLGTALVKFFLIDALSFARIWQYASLVLFGCFLLILASLTSRYRRYLRIYRNWNT